VLCLLRSKILIGAVCRRCSVVSLQEPSLSQSKVAPVTVEVELQDAENGLKPTGVEELG
jgi:hypothetical protein